MYTKTSPMQDLRIYPVREPLCLLRVSLPLEGRRSSNGVNCYRYGYLENVKALMVMVPPTKVLSSSADSLGRTGELFLHTYLLEKIMKCIFRVNRL